MAPAKLPDLLEALVHAQTQDLCGSVPAEAAKIMCCLGRSEYLKGGKRRCKAQHLCLSDHVTFSCAALEKQIQALFQKVLGKDRVSTTANFFAEGGSQEQVGGPPAMQSKLAAMGTS